MENKGNISIHAQNIMPVIKRWLYSDKDIFIREMVSNGCDAITKYKMPPWTRTRASCASPTTASA